MEETVRNNSDYNAQKPINQAANQSLALILMKKRKPNIITKATLAT